MCTTNHYYYCGRRHLRVINTNHILFNQPSLSFQKTVIAMNSLVQITRKFVTRTLPVQHNIAVRTFVKVGDKVPVNFVKDEPAPVIKDNSEYPEWVFNLGNKEPTLSELIERAETKGISEENFSLQDAKRMKRLLTLEQIKTNNAAKKSSSG